MRLEANRVYELQIEKVWRFNYYRKIQAMLQHPDNAIKIATGLALMSIFIGLLSIFGADKIVVFFKWITG